MSGDPLQKRKDRKVITGVGSHVHVKMVTEEIAFPVGIPVSVTVRLRIVSFTVTGAASISQTVTEFLFTLLCGGADRGAVTGKGKMPGANEAVLYGITKELLAV